MPKHACRVPDVLHQIVDQAKAPHRSRLLFDVCDVAELHPRPPLRFRVRYARIALIPLEHRSMELELVAQLSLERTPAQPVTKPIQELEFHRSMLERDQREAGVSDAEAQRRSRMQLGNVTYV